MKKRVISQTKYFVGILFVSLFLGMCNSDKSGNSTNAEQQSDFGLLLKKYPNMKLEYDSSKKAGYLILIDSSSKKTKSFVFNNLGQLSACIYYHPLDKSEYFVVKYGENGKIDKIEGKQLLLAGNIFEAQALVKDSFSVLIFPVHPPKYRSEIQIFKSDNNQQKYSEVAKHIVNDDNTVNFIGVVEKAGTQEKYCIVSKLTSEIDSSQQKSDTSCFVVTKR